MTLKEARDGAVKAYLYRVLSETGGSMTRAARVAGVHRVNFYKMLKRYDIQVQHRKYVRTIG